MITVIQHRPVGGGGVFVITVIQHRLGGGGDGQAVD